MKQEQFDLHAAIEEQHWWFLARRRILRQIIQHVLPPNRETRIIDIGCGTGANIASLADSYRCFGMDTSAEGIALARQRFPHVSFLCGQAPEDFGPEQQSAQMFLLTDVLEHVPDDFLFFSKLWQALMPGSYMLLTVPADESLWSEHDVSFGHYRRYDAPRLARVWEGLPVTVRLLSYYVSRLYPLVKLVRTFNRWRGQTGGMAGTDFTLPPRPVNRFLEKLMAGESTRLLRVLQGRSKPYRRGVSLIALLQRQPGAAAIRHRPADVPPDQHKVC
jgi:SAM-dependent methyltransferase